MLIGRLMPSSNTAFLLWKCLGEVSWLRLSISFSSVGGTLLVDLLVDREGVQTGCDTVYDDRVEGELKYAWHYLTYELIATLIPLAYLTIETTHHTVPIQYAHGTTFDLPRRWPSYVYQVSQCKQASYVSIVPSVQSSFISKHKNVRANWIFTHVGLSTHAHNIMQEVEVHGWLLKNRPFHIKQWNVGPSYDILHTRTVTTV